MIAVAWLATAFLLANNSCFCNTLARIDTGIALVLECTHAKTALLTLSAITDNMLIKYNVGGNNDDDSIFIYG